MNSVENYEFGNEFEEAKNECSSLKMIESLGDLESVPASHALRVKFCFGFKFCQSNYH